MAKKAKTADKGKNRDNQAKKAQKKTKAPHSAARTDASDWKQNPILKPFVLIGQIIWVFFDVATLLLRMLVYTLVYDNPHGKHEMMLNTAKIDAKQ